MEHHEKDRSKERQIPQPAEENIKRYNRRQEKKKRGNVVRNSEHNGLEENKSGNLWKKNGKITRGRSTSEGNVSKKITGVKSTGERSGWRNRERSKRNRERSKRNRERSKGKKSRKRQRRNRASERRCKSAAQTPRVPQVRWKGAPRVFWEGVPQVRGERLLGLGGVRLRGVHRGESVRLCPEVSGTGTDGKETADEPDSEPTNPTQKVIDLIVRSMQTRRGEM